MNIAELIERLEQYRDEMGDHAEVRLMAQQHWPFENAICGLTNTEEMNAEAEAQSEGEGEETDERSAAENIVYLVEGSQICYGRKMAWETCGDR